MLQFNTLATSVTAVVLFLAVVALAIGFVVACVLDKLEGR